jgi:hypothetical protein
MRDSTNDEFLEDFGDSLTDEQLQHVLAQARAAEDREVRLLVKQYLTLRRATRWLLAEVERASDISSLRQSEVARLARFCAGTEPSADVDARAS